MNSLQKMSLLLGKNPSSLPLPQPLAGLDCGPVRESDALHRVLQIKLTRVQVHQPSGKGTGRTQLIDVGGHAGWAGLVGGANPGVIGGYIHYDW